MDDHKVQVERLPQDGTGDAVASEVGKGEVHGIPLEQSSERQTADDDPPDSKTPRELRAEAVTVKQTEPSPVRPMEGAPNGVTTPGVAREASVASGAGSPRPAVQFPTRPGSSIGTGRSLSELRSLRGEKNTGLQTFGNKYMPFAAGFANMAEAAPVYRSNRLTSMNSTAAASDDMSFYYTLDSGRTEPGEQGEFVRNQKSAARSKSGKGGFLRFLTKPIS